MNKNPFFDPTLKKKPNIFIAILQILVVFTALVILLYLFVITPSQVDGPSMEPNFYTGELLLTNRLVQWFGITPIGKSIGMDYVRGDVVTFQKPGYKEFVKRIIGVPGDFVAIRDGYIYVNNSKLQEDYLPPALYTSGGDYLVEGGESALVEEGFYIAIGDNRPVSNDSRFQSISQVDRKWIKGRVILRFFPFEKFSIIPTGKYELINEK